MTFDELSKAYFEALAQQPYGVLLGQKIEFDTVYEKETEAIRAKCSHSQYEIMYFSWRVGCMEPKQFCKDCGAMLGDPTPEELHEFNRKELEASKALWAKNYPGIEYPIEFEQMDRFKVQ